VNRLWWAQIRAVIRLELKKTFFARRGLWIYVVAALPILLYIAYTFAVARDQHRTIELAGRSEKPLQYQDLAAIQMGMTSEEVIAKLGNPPNTFRWTENRRDFDTGTAEEILHENYTYSDGQDTLFVRLSNNKVEAVHLRMQGFSIGDDTRMFAGVFQFFFLRLAVFFGCLGIFMNLFRGEILDRSLHFYFLAPVRRDVLMVGKFLAGFLATGTIFVTSVIVQTIVFLWHFPPAVRDTYLYHGHGLEHAAVYVGVTLLACLGYGAFFMVAGMLFRNPILPTAVILIWEGINPFLPSVLKQVSVIYYLKSLCPVDIQTPPGMPPLLALLISNSDPIAAPVAILGLIGVACGALYVSSVQVRRIEINYTSE
jgi:ABC-type transport system involved in multi-copper enzyme maturation permease subunit